MSEYVNSYIDKLINDENYRRMEQDPDASPVHPSEVQKLLDEDERRKEYEKNNGR